MLARGPVPFLPLLFVWHVFGRAASFALGWATSLFFGEIPGNKGRVLSAAAVISLAWVLLLTVVGPLLVIGIAGDAAGLVDLRAWNIHPAQVMLPVVGLVVIPPTVTVMGELSHFHEDRSVRRGIGTLPLSYPIALSLGTGFLLMLLVTPVVLLRHAREGRATEHIALVVKEGRFDQLADDLERWTGELAGVPCTRQELTGVVSWPMRTMRFAAAHLLRSVVTADPVRLRAGDVEVSVFATNLSVTAPRDDVYRWRAALHKRLALTEAYFTWSEEPQRFEGELMRLQQSPDLALEERIAALERLQEQIDAAKLKSDEWEVLYRLRLQIERDAYEASARRPGRSRAS